MSLVADEITIAVTVFNRRQFLKQAIRSALAQSVPVRVIVVEDCGPDSSLRDFVAQEFGSGLEYFRNPQQRGLFDNWNACMEYCRTPWLSILHDDDFLAPHFVASMLELSKNASDCGIYYGLTGLVDEGGEPLPGHETKPLDTPWRQADLMEAILNTPFPFPGHVFRIDYALALGGFRPTSQFTGDWEMWARLIAYYGGAQTNVITGYQRSHSGPERGTQKVYLNGRMWPLVSVQRKRVIHLLRQRGTEATFDRKALLRKSPMPVSFLVRHGSGLSPRMLKYCVDAVRRSSPPSIQYALFKLAVRLFGVRFVKTVAALYASTRPHKICGIQTAR